MPGCGFDRGGCGVTDTQKAQLAIALHEAWKSYTKLLGEPPHGTLKQLSALVEFVHIEGMVSSIEKKAVAKFYAEGQR